ncbi:zinc-binding dehydrogenase [Permianibacter sp. IMCC34836]|uniref:zinc-binding dehydrogenase n=1 Tax=Permianibacter fluminis TaxID=2738515 RepID=UPI0015552947|nr:zinc-binding dehydrogenase [Permianibacter fluminis]NQD38517.1 zinc-binding dehydrogenase [Permianibacter fluminis]
MPDTRRVWRTPRAGNLADLHLQDEPLPELPLGQVRVAVRAVGLNFADIFALTGLYSATPSGAFIPGLEFAGVVIASHLEPSAEAAFKPGDRVMGCIRFGAYASVVDVAPAQLAPLPDNWDFGQGAAFLVQTFTAWYALNDLGALAPGRLTLIHSAAGGVGLQAMRICAARGVPVIGTVSDANKKKFLQQQGFAEVLIRAPDFASQLCAALADRPLYLVLDAIGGPVQQASFAALAPTGRLVVFGAADYAPGKRRPNWLKIAWKYLTRPRYDALAMISDNKSVLAFNLIWLWQHQSLFRQLLADVQALALPPPHVGHRFTFVDAASALECLRSGRSVGKVVLELPG